MYNNMTTGISATTNLNHGAYVSKGQENNMRSYSSNATNSSNCMDETIHNKRRGSDGGTEHGKRGKNEIKLQTEDIERGDLRDVMVEYGHITMSPKGGMKTKVRIEWVLDEECMAFNIQAALIGSIKIMKKLTKSYKS